ncbi:DNA/RNA non-specific endonuclease [Achromobacter sp. UMC46]|uniref:DNA/RNA non-specific endonuclease n=1 Tax=Achromobacter sp. UMC46 TaxID=1862319 RepID=UPI00160346B6|nr:DNA/RNA non-specific endonuclease [Achromobacter sp. UMC46]
MTRTKKPVQRKRRPATRTQARSAGRTYRFLRALLVSSLASFGAATYVLKPQWPAQFSPDAILARLGWPAQEKFAPAVVPTGALSQTRFADCPQFFPKGNMPVVPSRGDLRELCFSAFAILHSGQTKTPVFVAERLNRKTLSQAQGMQRTDKFYAEARLPRAERSDLDDYKGSGYSRGHMAPAGDMASKESMAQSFSLANMVPQDQTQNAGAWSRIEQDTRKYVMRAAGDVYVFTGPFYSDKPKTIGSGVAVPGYVYKVVYDATTGRSWVHWQANSASTKEGPPISYEEFVRRTGLQLLPSAG